MLASFKVIVFPRIDNYTRQIGIAYLREMIIDWYFDVCDLGTLFYN